METAAHSAAYNASEVFIVMKEKPDIYTEVERVWLDEEKAHEYILETYPYVAFYEGKGFYALADLDERDLEDETRFFIVRKDIEN